MDGAPRIVALSAAYHEGVGAPQRRGRCRPPWSRPAPCLALVRRSTRGLGRPPSDSSPRSDPRPEHRRYQAIHLRNCRVPFRRPHPLQAVLVPPLTPFRPCGARCCASTPSRHCCRASVWIRRPSRRSPSSGRHGSDRRASGDVEKCCCPRWKGSNVGVLWERETTKSPWMDVVAPNMSAGLSFGWSAGGSGAGSTANALAWVMILRMTAPRTALGAGVARPVHPVELEVTVNRVAVDRDTRQRRPPGDAPSTGFDLGVGDRKVRTADALDLLPVRLVRVVALRPEGDHLGDPRIRYARLVDVPVRPGGE